MNDLNYAAPLFGQFAGGSGSKLQGQ